MCTLLESPHMPDGLHPSNYPSAHIHAFGHLYFQLGHALKKDSMVNLLFWSEEKATVCRKGPGQYNLQQQGSGEGNVCISGTDLLRQFYVLPHWDRSCRPNFPSHPVTVYWHRADHSQHRPYNARHLAGWVAAEVPILKSLVWLDLRKILAQAGFEPGIFRSRGGHLTTRPMRRYRRKGMKLHG